MAVILVCSKCSLELHASDARCPACGASSASAMPQEIITAEERAALLAQKKEQDQKRFVDNPWLVLATIFFVTAAFGIPLIWMCRAWSETTKVFWTVVAIVYTIVVLWVFWLVMAWCYRVITDSL